MCRASVKRDSTVAAGVFKATCLELMDRVAEERRSITITKRGKPVARLVPYGDDVPPLFGSIPATILGDIVAPIGEEWDAER